MKYTHYLVSKSAYDGSLIYIDYKQKEGFKIKPKNMIKYEGIVVNKLVIVNPSFVEKILKIKTKRKLEYYLKLIIGILDDEDADPTDLRSALNDLTRYRKIVSTNYSKYLDERYIKLFSNKMTVIETELKKRISYLSNKVKENIEYEEKVGKSR